VQAAVEKYPYLESVEETKPVEVRHMSAFLVFRSTCLFLSQALVSNLELTQIGLALWTYD